MSFRVDTGEADFAELRQSGSYYVDKTEFIYELVNDVNNKVTLITRPRRFGKTLMMSMLENFFNIEKDSKHIFEGLAITKYKEFCKEWMNQYPVISISFKGIAGTDFDKAYGVLRSRIAEICKKIAYVINANTDVIDKDDLDVFCKLKSNSAEDWDIKDSLKTLMRILNTIYGKKVILLIDEYDVPLAKASEKNTAENEYYSRMLDVMQGIMSSALKDNEYLKFAVVTGCLRVAKESIFTGTNNFVTYSILDKRFSSFFGFSEDEIEKMLEVADRKEVAPVIKEWYDGYIFGNSYVYCPWDVMNYLSALKDDRTAKPKNYWKNTSHNGILLTFVKQRDFDVTDEFETLMNGGTISRTITEELTYDQLCLSEDNLWSILLMTGYVTKADTNSSRNIVSLKIPNKEILSLFEDTVIQYFEESVDTEKINELINALWDGNESQATEILSGLLMKTVSYNDYRENYYHAFLVGVFVGREYYAVSNKELGLGRPDIILEDSDNERAIIIEVKRSEKESDMDKDADKAIKQIIDEKYAEGIKNCNHILCYGISFFQKQAKVKVMKQ